MKSPYMLTALALGAAGVLVAPPAGADESLALPSLSSADHYIMAPSSRTVRPARRDDRDGKG